MTLQQVELDGLNDKVKKDLQSLALSGMPEEVCGVLHKHHIIHQYGNTFTGNRCDGFDMDVDLNASEVVAIWHSHPGGLPNPSRDDIPAMAELYSKGHVFPWIIVTSKSVIAWELSFQMT